MKKAALTRLDRMRLKRDAAQEAVDGYERMLSRCMYKLRSARKQLKYYNKRIEKALERQTTNPGKPSRVVEV